MPESLKVLHAITRLDRGGSSENTLISAERLARAGCRVDLMYGYTSSPSGPGIEKARSAGVVLIEERDLVRNIHPLRDVKCLLSVRGKIAAGKYDIVHCHSHKAGLICRVAAKLAGVRNIVYTPHGHVFYGYFSPGLTSLIITAEKCAAPFTDRIVCLTGAEKDEWLSFGIGREEQYAVIPSGVDFAEIDRLSERPARGENIGLPEGRIVIGSAGRLIGVKGHRYFVEAAIDQMRKRDDVVFVLLGDGPLREEYEEMVAESGFSGRFFFVPWKQNAAAVINRFDIFVLPSLNEGMGRVLVEAMYLGKPVIATRVGGVPSLVNSGTGSLVEPRSSDGISSAIDAVIDDQTGARARAENAREVVVSGYSADRMADDLLSLYRALAGR